MPDNIKYDAHGNLVSIDGREIRDGDIKYWNDGTPKSIFGEEVKLYSDKTVRSIGDRDVMQWPSDGTMRHLKDKK